MEEFIDFIEQLKKKNSNHFKFDFKCTEIFYLLRILKLTYLFGIKSKIKA